MKKLFKNLKFNNNFYNINNTISNCKLSFLFKSTTNSAFSQSVSNNEKLENKDWTRSELSMLKHLNVIDPIYQKVVNEKNKSLNDRKSNFNVISNPTKDQINSEYKRLLGELTFLKNENLQSNDYDIPEEVDYFLNKEDKENELSKAAVDLTVLDKDDNYQRRSVIVYLYDKTNISYWSIQAFKKFLKKTANLESISFVNDINDSFAFARLTFINYEVASSFKFQYSFKKLDEIVSSVDFENSDYNFNKVNIKPKMYDYNDPSKFMNNLIVVSSYLDFNREKLSDRTIILSELDNTITKDKIINMCSKYGSILNIYMPTINNIKNKFNELNIKENNLSSIILKNTEEAKLL